MNLKKDSLALVRDAKSNSLRCEFTFDANLPCWVSVFCGAKDAPREGSRLTLTENREPMKRVRRDAGLGQVASIDIDAADAAALQRVAAANATSRDSSEYALVVRLECVVDALGDGGTGGDAEASESSSRRLEPPAPAGSALDDRAQAQTTFAEAKYAVDDEKEWFVVSVLKQKIWVDGVSYELQEIFGIEHCSTGTPLDGGDGDGDEGDSGKECVVCMSEPRDTTALPCRHMCMCGACARMLRGQSNRCPICRTPVESLLEIKVASKDGE